MKKLFGTDGIRGHAGEFPLDENTVRMIGSSLAKQLKAESGSLPKIVTGRDTRESGEAIERAFHEGVKSAGAECLSAGVITTPGVAYLTQTHDFNDGVVISASHNPFEDNGIKIFTPSGKKADEQTERTIEADVAAGIQIDVSGAVDVDVSKAEQFQRDYSDHLAGEFVGLDLSKIKIVADCANGAASNIAPDLFRRFGADVTVIHADPNGRNINENCGSLHLEHLQKAVLENKADFGVAFDGDADRALFVDEKGAIVDGDATLWVMANFLLDNGNLTNRKVIATVMSNIGLELALRSRGIELIRTAVGDKYVLEELLASGSQIGGEQSGHVIFPDRSIVGDGMLTALFLLNAIRDRERVFSQCTEGFVQYPQLLVNVKVREKIPFETVPAIHEAAKAAEERLSGTGRLLLRYSGTENLARVMVEGREMAEIETLANELAAVIRTALG